MGTPSESDSIVIARSATDPAAFREVFERHFDGVWTYLRLRVGATMADDLAGETFAVGFAGRERFRGVSARPWLLGIASNLAARYWRDEERRLRAFAKTGVLENCDLDEDGLVARIHASDQASDLAAVIAELSSADRETLLLSAIGGLSNSEIAAALDLTPNAVGVRLHRIRTALAPRLMATQLLERE